ncbi:MAG: hypothetical protein IKK60_05475 [Clostridia bacterium]|nr:hypothetical protein [Clostridia bacterium]
MNRNHLKLIACLSMLIDHIGFVLFPEVQLFRILGRIAMPLFAFFIGEGCLHTRDRRKYFLRLFILALICQAVYITESIITGSGNGLYLNILFTFSCSVVLCSVFLRLDKDNCFKNRVVFIFTVCAFWAMDYLFEKISASYGLKLHIDYGIEGILLPVFAVMSKDKGKRLILFAAGLIFMAERIYGFFNLYFLFAMIPLLLLCFYNGEGGKRNMKYFFYLFYPLHLAVIYGVNLLINL